MRLLMEKKKKNATKISYTIIRATTTKTILSVVIRRTSFLDNHPLCRVLSTCYGKLRGDVAIVRVDVDIARVDVALKCCCDYGGAWSLGTVGVSLAAFVTLAALDLRLKAASLCLCENSKGFRREFASD